MFFNLQFFISLTNRELLMLQNQLQAVKTLLHSIPFHKNYTIQTKHFPVWGVQKLTGENLKLVWAEFSTLS